MKKIKKAIYSFINKHFLTECSDYNSLKVRKECRSKLQARDMFKKYNIPHADGDIFFNPYRAFQFARMNGFPLVIKPNVSGFSRGSHFPITNYWQLWKAALMVKIWWPFSVIEKYLEGENYRVVVVKGRIMSVLKRFPPFVIGDGQTSIENLIDKENVERQKLDLYPVMHPIQKNNQTIRYLEKQGYRLSSVPNKDEKVLLFNKIALAPGGIVETVAKATISPKNRELFLKILDVFQANIFGIDVIFQKGIETDYDQQQTIFLELNSRPYLKMHNYPRYGQKEDFTKDFAHLDAINLADSGIY